MHDRLAVLGVTRTFGGRTALDRVSFSVRPGCMTGFVGANGAGKTTAMRIILGVLAADSGRVELGGTELTLPVRRRFGYMPEERGLYPKMKVADQLVYLGRVHGLRASAARRRTAELLEQLGLADRADDALQTLSLGNQQRVQVAAALVHDPILLVLDEPFSGLDPLAVDAMAEQLRRRAAAGMPVLFSSHQLELVERLCDDIVIIDRGRIVAAGDAGGIRAERAGRRLQVVLDPFPHVPAGVGAIFTDLPGTRLHQQDGRRVVLELVAEDAPGVLEQQVLAHAQRHGYVREFGPVVPTLSEIFREAVR